MQTRKWNRKLTTERTFQLCRRKYIDLCKKQVMEYVIEADLSAEKDVGAASDVALVFRAPLID